MASATRYCFFKAASGLITIKVFAPPDIEVGADFRLYSPDKSKQLETFKIRVPAGQSAFKILDFNPRELSKHILIWQYSCCSATPAVYQGKVVMKALQGDDICKMTLPAVNELVNCPPCAVNADEKTNGHLIFINKVSE